jgi:hypothetical protein
LCLPQDNSEFRGVANFLKSSFSAEVWIEVLEAEQSLHRQATKRRAQR